MPEFVLVLAFAFKSRTMLDDAIRIIRRIRRHVCFRVNIILRNHVEENIKLIELEAD